MNRRPKRCIYGLRNTKLAKDILLLLKRSPHGNSWDFELSPLSQNIYGSPKRSWLKTSPVRNFVEGLEVALSARGGALRELEEACGMCDEVECDGSCYQHLPF